jgi:hypothetical protein
MNAMGPTLRLGLVLPAFIAIGTLVTLHFMPPGPTLETAGMATLMLASAASLASATIAIVRLARGTLMRSFASVFLASIAVLFSIPALLGAASIIYRSLPLTDAERRAIQVAETFVARNGYTVAGHPENLPVLNNDILDGLFSAEALKERRRGTLQARAFGISYRPPQSFLVYFDSIPANVGAAYCTIEVNQNGEARMRHMPSFLGPWFKRRG